MDAIIETNYTRKKGNPRDCPKHCILQNIQTLEQLGEPESLRFGSWINWASHAPYEAIIMT